MKLSSLTTHTWPLALLLLAGLALGNAGCLLVAAGAGAGAAAATYVWVQGKVCHTFPASLEDTWLATRKALNELGMPVVGEERETATTGFLKSMTKDGTTVRVYLEVQESPFPGENHPQTQVCVRVGTVGDDAISDRIMRQLSAHLAPVTVGSGGAAVGPPAPGATPWSAVNPPVPPGQPSGPLPPSTPPPPLLPPEPVKKSSP